MKKRKKPKVKPSTKKPVKAKPLSLTRASILTKLGKDQPLIDAKKNTKYTVRIGAEICLRMGAGETLTNICRDELMPSFQSVQNWRHDYPAFEDLYAKAQLAQTECWVEEVKAIADDGKNDWMERESRAGTYTVLNSEHVTRSQLRINAIKWIASVRNPKKYGPKAELNAGDSLKGVMESFAKAVHSVNNVGTDSTDGNAETAH